MPDRDLARIAYCMLREGRWRTGKSSRSGSWTRPPPLRTTSRVRRCDGSSIRRRSRTAGSCLRFAATHPADARYKPGSGGQLIAFVPSLDLVITRQTGASGEWGL